MVFLSFLKKFLENPVFRADGLKIYATLVIRGTGTVCLRNCAEEIARFGIYRYSHKNARIR